MALFLMTPRGAVFRFQAAGKLDGLDFTVPKEAKTIHFEFVVDNDPRAEYIFIGATGGHPSKSAFTLPAHPESFQFDEQGRRIFVNLPNARQIAVERFLRAILAVGGELDVEARGSKAADHASGHPRVVFDDEQTLLHVAQCTRVVLKNH